MTVRYRLEGIDPEVWRDFKAFAAMEGKTVRAKLLSYIHEQVNIFRGERSNQTTVEDAIRKAGEKE